jgi:hypothetical protein
MEPFPLAYIVSPQVTCNCYHAKTVNKKLKISKENAARYSVFEC